MARMEPDCNLENLGLTFQVVSTHLQKIDINGRGLFSLYDVTVLFSFRCSEIIIMF